jgi:hypothetical protein
LIIENTKFLKQFKFTLLKEKRIMGGTGGILQWRRESPKDNAFSPCERRKGIKRMRNF